MRNLVFTITLFLISINVSAQISTTRMNDLKVGMKLSEVERTLDETIHLAKDKNWGYTATINHKGSKFNVRFIEHSDNNGIISYSLFKIETTSTNIKTLSKVGIGSSIDDLWRVYKNYSISIWKAWDSGAEKYSETDRTFQLSDGDTGTALYFHLRNNKVYKISLNYYEEGC
ncbi:MAG: hypothetical protein ACK5IC_09375 [Moheibacter sp.]